MAHSDTLIFLTNISWIFFLFLSCYFFFVLYFLPTFYKKVRARSLIGTLFRRITFVFISQAKAYLQFAEEFKETFYLRYRSLVLLWKDRVRVASRLGRLRLPRPTRPWNTQPMHVYFKGLKNK